MADGAPRAPAGAGPLATRLALAHWAILGRVVVFLSVLLIIVSLLLVVLVLLHRGKGGGLSNLFGGGVSSSLTGSSVVEKNLDRFTIICGLVWAACIVGLGLLEKK